MLIACPRNLALDHLMLRVRPLLRALRQAVALRDAHATQLRAAGAAPLVITRGHAEALLDQAAQASSVISTGPAELSADELDDEEELRSRARATSSQLPLDAMREYLDLDELEIEVIALCAVPELDAELEKILIYVQDDGARRLVSVELACALTAESPRDCFERRAALGAFGRLRRHGLVAVTPRETCLRDELRLTPACFEALLGSPTDLAVTFRDPAQTHFERPDVVPADEDVVGRAAAALRARELDVVASWGHPRLTRDIVAALASGAGIEVRRLPPSGTDVASSLAAAAALGSALWIDVDALGESALQELVDAGRRTHVPLLLTGRTPWRPTELLAARDFVEIEPKPLDHATRSERWSAELPELDSAHAERIAATFQFDTAEIRAASRTARATAAVYTNGHVVAPAAVLAASCVTVARKHGERHTTMITPRRSATDLVLPPDLHARVLDIARYFRALPRVMDQWGFARRSSGHGIKALFTGEPGTGKTLAAEVVAGELGLPMLKVDLARVVSKWVGETEKNLDHVFTEARDSHAVLFFDEAEALFGARGDVRHGTDRYANLEVSYLLQRLEAHAGVVILATNLRDKIDQAFIRRFHAVIGFPRPSERERKRMWQQVFGSDVPLDGEPDIALLAKLDLTGAGIVGAAQTAAFFAADEGSAMGMSHVVRGLVRQYQREARVLTAKDLGPYAGHLHD